MVWLLEMKGAVGLQQPEAAVVVFEQEQPEVVVCEIVHAAKWQSEHQAKKALHSPPVHADEHQLFLVAKDFFQGRFLASLQFHRVFSARNAVIELAGFPVVYHIEVFLFPYRATFHAFVISPADLVEFGECGMRNSCVQEGIYGLMRTFQRRGINAFEGKVAVTGMKAPGLFFTGIIQVTVYPAALYDTEAIEFRFAVSHQVDCFSCYGKRTLLRFVHHEKTA